MGPKSISAYAAKHFELSNSFLIESFDMLIPILWQKPLKISLFFTPKYRSQLLSSFAKISVANCIMPMLL